MFLCGEQTMPSEGAKEAAAPSSSLARFARNFQKSGETAKTFRQAIPFQRKKSLLLDIVSECHGRRKNRCGHGLGRNGAQVARGTDGIRVHRSRHILCARRHV